MNKLNIILFRLKNEIENCKKDNHDLEQYISLENSRFENRFFEILSKYFTPTQVNMFLYPTKKVYRWTPEDISSAITLRSVSPKAYRYLRVKKNFPLPG